MEFYTMAAGQGQAGVTKGKHKLHPIAEEEEEFGAGQLGFPTDRRPNDYRRSLATPTTQEIETWFLKWKGTIGMVSTPGLLEKIKQMLYTWRDLFVEDVRDMPATDLLEH